VTDLLNVSKAREDELGDNAFIIGSLWHTLEIRIYGAPPPPPPMKQSGACCSNQLILQLIVVAVVVENQLILQLNQLILQLIVVAVVVDAAHAPQCS